MSNKDEEKPDTPQKLKIQPDTSTNILKQNDRRETVNTKQGEDIREEDEKLIANGIKNPKKKLSIKIQNPDKEQNNLTVSNIKKGGAGSEEQPISTEKLQLKRRYLNPTRRKVKQFMNKKLAQNFIISLVVGYTGLIFATLALDATIDRTTYPEPFYALLWVEFTILVIFISEITLNAYGTGWGHYFRDKWLLFDTIIIGASLIMVCLDLFFDFGDLFSTITQVIRGVFRFLRIFLLIRKVQTFKKIKTSSKIQTPAEKILEIFAEIKDFFDSIDVIQDIEWTMDMISSNKLYEPVLLKGEEAANWVNVGKNQLNQGEEEALARPTHQSQNQKKATGKVGVTNDKLVGKSNLKQIPVPVLNLFEKCDDLTFNCFEAEKLARGEEMSFLMIYLFEKNDLFTNLNINPKTFTDFAKALQNGYKNNPYHRKLHAFDVMQTCNFFIKKCKFIDLAELSYIDLAAMYIAAGAHDFEHPGLNNPFLINTKNAYALTYNDISVLENHHIAATFKILLQDQYNILVNFNNDEYKKFREIIISTILQTDMARHFTDIAKLKGRLSSGGISCFINPSEFDIKGKDKMLCMDSIMHSCDISNPIKTWNICFQWTEFVLTEFWEQGDKERELGIPITYLCDRYTTHITKSQLGFIDFIVKPLYEVLQNFLPDLTEYLENFQVNKDKWSELSDKYDLSLKRLKEEKDKKQQ